MKNNKEYMNSEDEDMDDNIRLEKWYVFRSLHSDESWGATLINTEAVLPNCDFLMKVFAVNEKEAIARAKDLYEKIHKYDSKRDNIRRFAAAALKSTTAAICHSPPAMKHVTEEDTRLAAKLAMQIATAMDEEYEEHFSKLVEDND